MIEGLDGPLIGEEIFSLARKIFPICRSITGNGVRATLRCLSEHIDLQIHEVPSGTDAFDWSVPQEWNIRDAYIKDSAGNRVIDFHACNLHVVSYSIPVRGRFPLSELRRHIHTLPDQPDLIPYRTSYYRADWGFCMAHDQLQNLQEESYEVLIDSSLEQGSLTYGEYLHRGTTDAEVLLSTHICHPSMANDNCSGISLLTMLARRLVGRKTRYSYRFVFVPGTIGAIVWLSRNERAVSRIKHGLVISGVGDGGGPTYKKSRRSCSKIDMAMEHVLRHDTSAGKVIEFSPYGYDERQYCSPGFNLPVGLLQRSQFAKFPEYHTSGDDLDFIHPEHLGHSYSLVVRALDIIENDIYMVNLQPKCEPQLGRRGLYGSLGGAAGHADQIMTDLWVLNYSDGEHSLLDIANRADLPFRTIRESASRLSAADLLSIASHSKE